MTSILEQKNESGGGPCVRPPLPVIDNQYHPIVFFVNLIDERGQDVAGGVVAVLLEHLTHRRGGGGPAPPNQLEQMRQEPHHVVVVVVDRQPADRDAVARELLSPLGRQRALAEARGRVDKDQPSPAARPEDVQQPIAGHQRLGRNRWSVLRRRGWRRRRGRVAPNRRRGRR